MITEKMLKRTFRCCFLTDSFSIVVFDIIYGFSLSQILGSVMKGFFLNAFHESLVGFLAIY